jgi:small subunit ribosomal protein S17
MSENETIVKHRKRRIGVVVSDKMDKSVSVMVERMVKHPQFRKEVRRRKKFMAHDADNTCNVGDRVLIEEVRPLSKLKRWQVIDVIEKAK